MGNFETSENSEPSPSFVNITPSVVGNTLTASMKLTLSADVVTPNGIPISVAATIPISIAPFTLSRRSTIVRTRPIINTYIAPVLITDMDGTPAPKLMAPTFNNPM